MMLVSSWNSFLFRLTSAEVNSSAANLEKLVLSSTSLTTLAYTITARSKESANAARRRSCELSCCTLAVKLRAGGSSESVSKQSQKQFRIGLQIVWLLNAPTPAVQGACYSGSRRTLQPLPLQFHAACEPQPWRYALRSSSNALRRPQEPHRTVFLHPAITLNKALLAAKERRSCLLRVRRSKAVKRLQGHRTDRY